MPFDIIKADIKKVKADAVFTSANATLPHDSYSNSNVAGNSISEVSKSSQGYKVGEIRLTQSDGLLCRYVIYTASPVRKWEKSKGEKLIYSCYKNILEFAVKKSCGSIALPLIGADAGSFSRVKAFEIARAAIGDFLDKNNIKVIMVVSDEASLDLGEDIFKEMLRYKTCFGASKKSSGSYKRRFSSFTTSNILTGSFIERLNKPDVSFSQKLLSLIDERGLKDAYVYKKANITRQVFAKIRADKNYHPKKNTVFAFAIALELSLEETEDLLKSAGYAFSKNNKTDIIVQRFIEKGYYNIYKINCVLDKYDCPLLGSY